MLFGGALPNIEALISELDVAQLLIDREHDFIASYDLIPSLRGRSISFTEQVDYGEELWEKKDIIANLYQSQVNDKAQISYNVSALVATNTQIDGIPSWFIVVAQDVAIPEQVVGDIELLGGVGVPPELSSHDLVTLKQSVVPGTIPEPSQLLPVRVPL
ncbi:hypothetical protein CWB96_00090 [Pseudoalteromonas citrea]|nr:hypothetical protein CWB96_00090 [Pseudoalteromonas citrea]